MSSSIIIEGRDIEKNFSIEGRSLNILKGIDFQLYKGEDCCIVGGSGAGKSTLLHILGGLDRPTRGSVYFEGININSIGDEELAGIRNKSMGFVFQFHHLLQEFTAAENVALPARIANVDKKAAIKKSEKILSELGLSGRLRHYPSQLSGGEQQRVAIARALIMSPQVLFADEPTGNLDSENASKIQDLFFELKRSLGITLLVVTHDRQFASRFSRVKTLKDGSWI